MEYTRSQILENRKKWAEFLMKPGRRKAQSRLDTGGGNRCCLGHACYVLGIKPENKEGIIYYDESFEMAPERLINMLGLWQDDGATENYEHVIPLFPEYTSKYNNIKDLAAGNDETSASPQRIGKYLMTVLEGGKHTPFRPLTDYSE